MNKGERIRMIIEAAENLAPLSWGKAWLISREFGFEVPSLDYDDEPNTDWWIRVLEPKDQGDLPGLHSYLSGTDQAPQPTGRWATVPLSVFLSHLDVHRDFALRLQFSLRRFGIGAFVAHVDIEPSKAWRDEIKAALASCHAFVALLHDRFHQSEWCDQELGWAMCRRIPIVPVRFSEGERLGGFLADFQQVDIKADEEQRLARKIFKILFDDPRTHDDGVRALMEAFVNSFSFDTTRWLWELIVAEPRIESDQLRRLEHAVVNNRQVGDAVSNDGTPIPELVAQLVKGQEPVDPWADEPPF